MNVLAIIKLELCKIKDTLLGSANKNVYEKEVAINWDLANMKDTK